MAGKVTKKKIDPSEILTGKVIEIRPLPGNKWHGNSGLKDISGVNILKVPIDGAKRMYKIELTNDELELISSVIGRPVSLYYNEDEINKFWDENSGTELRLENKTTIIKIDNIYDLIRYKIALASPYIANSYKEYEIGLWPRARYYIVDREEELSRKYEDVNIKREAYILSSKLTRKQKDDIVMLVLNIDTRNNSHEHVETLIGDIIESKASTFINFASSLLNGTDKDREYLSLKALVYRAVDKGILINKDGTGVYYFNEARIGDIESVISKLSNPKEQSFYLAIIEKVDG